MSYCMLKISKLYHNNINPPLYMDELLKQLQMIKLNKYGNILTFAHVF